MPASLGCISAVDNHLHIASEMAQSSRRWVTADVYPAYECVDHVLRSMCTACCRNVGQRASAKCSSCWRKSTLERMFTSRNDMQLCVRHATTQCRKLVDRIPLFGNIKQKHVTPKAASLTSHSIPVCSIALTASLFKWNCGFFHRTKRKCNLSIQLRLFLL